MDFVTDLNHRERSNLVDEMRMVLNSMEKLFKALESGDDQTLLIEYVLSTLGWHSVRTTLDRVMKDAVEAMKGAEALKDFKGF